MCIKSSFGAIWGLATFEVFVAVILGISYYGMNLPRKRLQVVASSLVEYNLLETSYKMGKNPINYSY